MGHSLVSFSCLLNDIFIKILCADHLLSQKQQRAPFISEISSTSLFHRNSSHLFSFFYPSAWSRTCWNDQIPGGSSCAWQCCVPVAPLPLCRAVFGCPCSPTQSSSDLMDTHTSAASPHLQCQACASSGLHWIYPSLAPRNAGFIYTAFGVCSDKDPFIWELLWCQEMWQLP